MLKKKEDIPNSEGFEFLARLKNGGLVTRSVKKNALGQHYVENYQDIEGWFYIGTKKNERV